MIENCFRTNNAQQIKRTFNILISLSILIHQLIKIIGILFFLFKSHQPRFPF